MWRVLRIERADMTERMSAVGRVNLWEIVRILSMEASPFVMRRMAGVAALVVAAAALTGLGPVALKFIVDGLAHREGARPASPLLFVALYVLALWLARTADEVRGLVFAGVEQRIFRTLSERLFSHLMCLPLRFHLDRQSGAVSQTLDNGLQGLGIILHHLVFTYLPVTVELATVLLVLAGLVTLPFVFLFCGALASYLIAFAYSAATINIRARRASAARIDAAGAMMDGLLNYETVKYFAAETAVQERVANALRRAESEWVGFYGKYALNGLAVAAIFAAFIGATALYAVEEVQQNRMTLGDFVLVNTYMLQVARPVELIGYATQGLSHGLGMVDKLVRLFREPAEPGPYAASTGDIGPGSLEFQDVCVSYGPGRPVLKHVSFLVCAGSTLGLVGPSGSGKSTVVRLLMRLLEPESGTILLDGAPISGIAQQDLRRSIAVVPQDTVLFDDTMRYNIAFGRPDASFQEIEEAARVAQLHELIMALPDRYDTRVGERGVKLSGGERQRVSIARAVLKSPTIYVFDEATSSLDSRTEREIVRSLHRIAKSKTALVIAHRLSSVVDADEIVVLYDGRTVEHGTHDALLRRNGRYAALWRAQQGGAAAA